ncbi:response regulator [Pseudochryseolinea flava]|uniref:DNA-binding response regulator n=1 Tax=Pseudochryseolinea flava TaxID=2059302 RepID=A0A364Y7H7_9BACT|nr:response regulator transcription factor [Pseudochryseolinea flava]RAW02347.1 DNA-binding response regulator [Pseudochryseolinea flava]
MKKRIKVILADDHQMFLEGLHAMLSVVEDIHIVGMALNGNEVVNLLKVNDVDLVVTDISMPGMDGIALNTVIKKQYPHVKTLVLTTYSDPDKILKLVGSKANGYLLKNAEKDELLKAIFTITSGDNYFSKEVQEKYTASVFSTEQTSAGDPVLSKREKEILKYIAEEFTTPEIAEKLFISQYTVNTHRKNLISKLGVKNVAGLVKYAFQKGLA